VLILTTFDLDEYVYAALRAGASGFLLKDALTDDLLAAVRAVASGEAVTAPASPAGSSPTSWGTRLRRPTRRAAYTLTARNARLLTLIGRGRSNTEIQQGLVPGRAGRAS